jgi:hypothetical protein
LHNPAQLVGLWNDMRLIGTRADDLICLSDTLDLVSVGEVMSPAPLQAAAT